ncbi:MAG TPA: LamG-like jellyroll fold domain-containing protein [Bacteroidota bacterium]|nr:LamG-like jellyroll fold domain-containing protein [Bacteroidota bacterium]
MKNALIILLSLTSSLAICQEPTHSRGGIIGRVIDAHAGTPVALVQIQTSPTSGVAVTDNDGKYYLQGLKFGKYTVNAKKDGYENRTLSVNVISEKTTADILLIPKETTPPAHRGLVAHYPFDGDLRDVTRTGPDAKLYNVHWVADRSGKPNRALHFNGTSSFARLGNAIDDVFSRPNASFTISGWANTDALPSIAGAGCIIAKSFGGDSGPYQWSIGHDTDGRIKGSVMSRLDASAFNMMESNPIPVGRWFHFALVFDSSLPVSERVTLYVDGTPGVLARQKGILGTSTEPSDQEITLGATHWPHNPLSPANLYEGSIDDIRIFDRALTRDDVMALASKRN